MSHPVEYCEKIWSKIIKWCFNPHDIFHSFNLSLVPTIQRKIVKKYGCDRKMNLVIDIWKYGFFLILIDILVNNIMFLFPNYKTTNACLFVETYSGDVLKEMRRTDKFRSIDLMKTDGTASRLTFKYDFKLNGTSTSKRRWIYTTSRFFKLLYENMCNGKYRNNEI